MYWECTNSTLPSIVLESICSSCNSKVEILIYTGTQYYKLYPINNRGINLWFLYSVLHISCLEKKYFRARKTTLSSTLLSRLRPEACKDTVVNLTYPSVLYNERPLEINTAKKNFKTTNLKTKKCKKFTRKKFLKKNLEIKTLVLKIKSWVLDYWDFFPKIIWVLPIKSQEIRSQEL